MNAFNFPPELVSPKEKEKPEYGLQYIKAAYNTNSSYGQRIMANDTEFDSLVEIAQGRGSVDGLKRLFTQYNFNRRPDFQDGPESLVFIDPQTLPLAPKYINRAVAKMQGQQYDVGLDAIDLLSVNEKTDAGALIKAFFRFRDWTKNMGVPLQAAFPDIDISAMPQYADEMMYDINTNPKLKKEISGELGLKLIMAMNNFEQKIRQFDWDLAVIGRGHLHLYLDHNKVPRIERINPKYWFGSYVDNDDFEQQEYAGFVECITVNQFIREASPYYTREQLDLLIRKHGVLNSSFSNPVSALRTLQNNDNLTYIPVARFYFRSEDNRTFVKRPNQHGSKIMMEKSFDYQPSEQSRHRFEPDGDSKIIKNTYTSIYGGTWIIDSDVVYNYGLKPYPRTNLVEATLPIKTFAANYKEGRTVSLCAQMIEPLFMVNVCWNKIKGILAQEYMGVMEIDFTQIENVAVGRGGREWSAREVMDLLLMSRKLVKRGNTNPNAPANSTALHFHDTGINLTDYMNMLTMSINMLEAITGTTAVESQSQPDRLAVGVMKASQAVGDYDMEYLYNGHRYMVERTAHHLLLLLQQAKADKAKIRGFVPALGKLNAGFYEVPDEIAYCEYGFIITRKPSQEEWASFYMDISIALKEGRIGPADSAFVREIDNLKQARQVLVNREIQYQRKLREEKMIDNQANMESNMAAAEAKLNSDMMIMDQEKKNQAELLILEGQIQEKLQNQKAEQDSILKSVEMEMKAQIAKQTSVDEIMKQGLRNIPEKQKVAQKGVEAVMRNQQASEASRMKFAVDIKKASQKPKAPAKK